MLNGEQIRLVQTARRKAGLEEGRYRFLLGQYKRPNGKPVTSCKELDRRQVEDFLAICEGLGWRYPGKSETHYRDKVSGSRTDGISTAQIEAVRYLAGDLGMNDEGLKRFVLRMTHQRTSSLLHCCSREGWMICEALIAMLGRQDGTTYKTLAEVKNAYATTDLKLSADS